MKTKVLLLSALLILKSINIVQHNPVFKFLIDGRPKQIMYWNVTPRIIHIDIEVIQPIIKKDSAAFESLNIFFFPKDFDLVHTISWRYVKFIEA
jgi:hypothetical protein|tara:strand:- start:676 stop:957 length:282 start_codon:yes stop_codon:yes gene_type:complete